MNDRRPADPREWVDTTEAARMIRVTRKVLIGWCGEPFPRLPFRRVGKFLRPASRPGGVRGPYRFLKSDVELDAGFVELIGGHPINPLVDRSPPVYKGPPRLVRKLPPMPVVILKGREYRDVLAEYEFE